MSPKSRKELEDALEEANQRVFQVWKSISSNTRGNKYHDARGRFAEAPSGDNALHNIEIKGPNGEIYNTEANHEVATYARQAMLDAHVYGDVVTGTTGPNILAQAHWEVRESINGKLVVIQKLVISPDADKILDNTWSADRELVKQGKTPFNSAGYASTREQAMKTIVDHEVGHMVLTAHTVDTIPKDQWADPANPSRGPTSWKNMVNTSAKGGWPAPTQYAMTNLSEAWAESYATKKVKGSSGSKDVDKYIDGVISDVQSRGGLPASVKVTVRERR